MNRLRTSLRRLVQTTGYDFHKLHDDPGRDPYRDIRQRIGTNSPVVFDVGANTGQTIASILQTLPDANIHAFEPHRAAFERLIRFNAKYKNVVLNNYALGARCGKQTLFEN